MPVRVNGKNNHRVKLDNQKDSLMSALDFIGIGRHVSNVTLPSMAMQSAVTITQ